MSASFYSKFFSGDIKFIAGSKEKAFIPPPDLSEIAFVGRSNVGKSSLINAICNRKALARVSHTPGRTKQINFFNVCNKFTLVDLPGYGFAKVSRQESKDWGKLIVGYLSERPTLKRIFILVDGRHGLKDSDLEVMSIFEEYALSYQIIFTKADKVKKEEAEILFSESDEILKDFPNRVNKYILTSARDKEGIDQIRKEIFDFL